MPGFFSNNMRGVTLPSRSKRRGTKKVKPSRYLTQAVQQIISKNVESKHAYHEQTLTQFNSSIGSSGDVLQIFPDISQGFLDNARIGDQIRLQGLKIKGHIIMNLASSYTDFRIGVRQMIVQPKNFTDQTGLEYNFNVWYSTLLKKGGATVPFTGIISDLYSDINTDVFTVLHDEVHFMTQAATIPQPGGNGAGGGTTSQVVDHQSCKFFSINLPTKNKLLRYDSDISGGVNPVNFAPVMLVGYVNLNGAGADNINTKIAMEYVANAMYEDA